MYVYACVIHMVGFSLIEHNKSYLVVYNIIYTAWRKDAGSFVPHLSVAANLVALIIPSKLICGYSPGNQDELGVT